VRSARRSRSDGAELTPRGRVLARTSQMVCKRVPPASMQSTPALACQRDAVVTVGDEVGAASTRLLIRRQRDRVRGRTARQERSARRLPERGRPHRRATVYRQHPLSAPAQTTLLVPCERHALCYLSDASGPAVNHPSLRDRSSPTYGPPSAAALSFRNEVSQRFLMSREAIGAASLPRPLKLTSSSTRTEVPMGDGVRL
jgi:hypothetical protein